MKILFIPAWYPTEKDPTAGVFIRKQAEAVAALGCETGAIYFQNLLLDGLFSEKMGLFQSEKNGVCETRLRSVWPFPKRNEWLLNRWTAIYDRVFEAHAARFGRPDLFHAEGLHALFVAQRLSKKHKIPFVFTEQSSAFRQKKVPRWLFPLLKNGWETAEKVVAVGPDLKSEMVKIWPTGAERIEVVPNLFSDSDFPPGRFSTKKDATEQPVFLTVGALEPKKGHDLLIEAFEIFRKKRPEKARLEIVGDGPWRGFLAKKARKSTFFDSISMPGALTGERLRERFLAADFFVLPSRHETFGVVAAEAMASGLPVLATRSGGPEHFLDEKTGLAIEPENPEQLAEGMAFLIEKAADWDRPVISKTAHERFSSRAVGSRLVEIYAAVLREKRVF